MKKFLLSFLFALPVHASVMNLNNFMPTRLEDATPIPKSSFDAQFSSEIEQRHTDMMTIRPNVRYGLTNDVQLETQATLLSGGSENNHGETDFSVLYRVLKGKKLPSVSLTPLLAFPTGKGQLQAEFEMRVNVTYTLRGTPDEPLTEIHFNLGSRTQKNREALDRGSLEGFATGISHRLQKNMSLIVDYIHEEDDARGDALQLVELGLHTHLGHQVYLGVSYSQGFGNSITRSSGLLGLEKQFGP